MMPFKRKSVEVNDLEEAKKIQSQGKKEKKICVANVIKSSGKKLTLS